MMDFILQPIKVYCNVNVTVFYSKNNKWSSSSKHIDLKYYVVRERIKDGYAMIEHIDTKELRIQ